MAYDKECNQRYAGIERMMDQGAVLVPGCARPLPSRIHADCLRLSDHLSLGLLADC